MLRWSTSGESHGQALIALLEGMPRGVEMSTADVQAALARRRLGYGRGARMKFEADEVTLVGGFRYGHTLGSPISILIGNTEWPKWTTIMSPDPVDAEDPEVAKALHSGRGTTLTRPRPGHADFAGMVKYGATDARDILERSSARETAARVAVGEVAKQFLTQAAGITILSHVVAIGGSEPRDTALPQPGDEERIDASPVRALSEEATQAMVARIDEAKKQGDTLGGVVEVVAHGLPIGLGSHVSGGSRLDGQLAQAVMSIQAIKGVEIGDGFAEAERPGSAAHDEIILEGGTPTRASNRAGGLEGGMTNGQPLVVRAAMKPISTVPRALRTVDMANGEPATAIHQRSDVCAVPAAAVVAEAEVALVVARAVLDKFGGDTVDEVAARVAEYREYVDSRLHFAEGSHE
ncbi:chorismate synthase [Corynebacterium pyruviciproducens ATCC BAA-1742]|uniref:Chorismate synthase n=1 Tax=Corynebacterium pyruviciproducens ATCC BAA-1742 TaxID=1125779 RepID=S3A1V2_9CORY|nr:chorismate synthase [Corynebacterium pyruviciproducens]EPD70249.1 chorismate synthase [Corynebacterium pyruviciproducens ATCC BAA-1742]MDK6566025.1 chorismate synthase [Corynebacterium pyruviciproducens]MDK7213634.1 chorismate synthase [Corynebacterium pyruviciproducens]